jgi:predicted GNAT family N-acyltransferase
MSAQIRYADNPADREAVYRLRYDVYVREMHMFGDVADHTGGRLLDSHDDTGHLIIAEVDGAVVGTCRVNWGGDAPLSSEHRATYVLDPFLAVLAPARILVVTRLVVAPAHRNTELTLRLVVAAAEFGAARETTLAFCDCQPHLINLYQGLGFRSYTVAYNDPNFGIMVPLVLVSPDTSHFEALRSPLAQTLRGWPVTPLLPKLLAMLPDTPPVREALVSRERLDTEVASLIASRSDGSVRFFDDVGEDSVRRLLKRGHLIECTRGDVVIRRGQILRTLFVVLSGDLEARLHGNVINVVRAGECFGEIAFLQGIPRTVDLVASSPRVLILSLNEATVRRLVADEPELAAKVFLNLARGLAQKLARRDGS